MVSVAICTFSVCDDELSYLFPYSMGYIYSDCDGCWSAYCIAIHLPSSLYRLGYQHYAGVAVSHTD